MMHNMDDISEPPLVESANAATTTTLRQEIQELRQMVQKLTQHIQPKGQKQKKPRQYCWTHGWCAHNGTQCQAPADGHKIQATLANKLGGSNNNCPEK